MLPIHTAGRYAPRTRRDGRLPDGELMQRAARAWRTFFARSWPTELRACCCCRAWKQRRRCVVRRGHARHARRVRQRVRASDSCHMGGWSRSWTRVVARSTTRGPGSARSRGSSSMACTGRGAGGSPGAGTSLALPAGSPTRGSSPSTCRRDSKQTRASCRQMRRRARTVTSARTNGASSRAGAFTLRRVTLVESAGAVGG